VHEQSRRGGSRDRAIARSGRGCRRLLWQRPPCDCLFAPGVGAARSLDQPLAEFDSDRCDFEPIGSDNCQIPYDGLAQPKHTGIECAVTGTQWREGSSL
jgi:hypothetical protein